VKVLLSDSFQGEVTEAISALGEVDVVKLEHDGQWMALAIKKDEKGNLVCPDGLLEEIRLFVTEGDCDWEIKIKRGKMLRFEYDNLPEFPGW